MNSLFLDFDFDGFWSISEYATKEYVGSPITPEMVETVGSALGYQLPESYLFLMNSQNGGIPKNTNHPMSEGTSWAQDHVAISGIFGLDSLKSHSLTGDLGGEFMKDEWGYPDIGVYVCDCPSAGHDMIALDYTQCGNNGEPRVVHVDQESDYKVTFVAKNFEYFICNLVHDSEYDEE